MSLLLALLSELPVALLLLALCVTIHAAGLTAALHWTRRWAVPGEERIWPFARMLIGVAGWSVLLHLVQIALWAFVYTEGQALPDLRTALYFSVVTYTTTGYGDLVLPPHWRLVGGVEALTGILMCGLSTGFFFATAQRGIDRK